MVAKKKSWEKKKEMIKNKQLFTYAIDLAVLISIVRQELTLV